MRDDLRRTTLLFLALSVVVLSAALGLLTILSVSRYEARLLPEIQQKALAGGHEINRRIAQALAFDRDLRALRGVADYFDKAIEQAPELVYLAIHTPSGAVTAERGVAALTDAGDSATAFLELPIIVDDQTVGTLHVGIKANFAKRILQEMSHDVLTVLAISLLITFGLLSFFIQVGISGRIEAARHMIERIGGGDLRPRRRDYPADHMGRLLDRLNDSLEALRRLYGATLARLEAVGAPAAAAREALQRLGIRCRLTEGPADDTPAASRLAAMRLIVFIFFLAEEVTRPFLPLYIREFTADTALAISLPLSVFILVAAFAQPWGGLWSERIGRRRAFRIAAVMSVIGLTMTAFSQSYWELVLWRILCATGYGIVFITCQGYTVDNTTPQRRAQGMAMFVGGVMAAMVCGPSIGGVIADHLGHRTTLLVAAGVAATAALVAHRLMSESEHVVVSRQAVGLRQIVKVLANPRMALLVLLAAVPAKIALAGALFYLTPLYLTQLNEPQSVVGRVMILYGLAMVVFGPMAARYADVRRHQRPWLVAVGTALSGIGLVPMLWLPGNLWVLMLGIACLGIGQSLSVSPQLAMVAEVAPEECAAFGITTVLGVFRLIERAGGALGPFVAALLAEQLGNAAALAAIGGITTTVGLLFGLSVLVARSHPRSLPEGG